jgi:hypothetical protein
MLSLCEPPACFFSRSSRSLFSQLRQTPKTARRPSDVPTVPLSRLKQKGGPTRCPDTDGQRAENAAAAKAATHANEREERWQGRLKGYKAQAARASGTGTAAAKPKTGGVSGRIFLITKAGDIKPARFAKIFLFEIRSTDSAGQTWSIEFQKSSEDYIEELHEPPAVYAEKSDYRDALALSSGSLTCMLSLSLTYGHAALAALNWPDQSFVGQADEDGVFKIAHIPLGTYRVVAEGRAGLNEARWVDSVTITQDKEPVMLKLASPERSCLDAN